MSAPDRPGCHLCGDEISRSLAEMLDHLRVIHPDVYGEGPEEWADGGLVYYEDADDWDKE